MAKNSDDPDARRRARESDRAKQRRQYTRELHARRTRTDTVGTEPPWSPPEGKDPMVVRTSALAGAVAEFLKQWEWSVEDILFDRSQVLLTGLSYLAVHTGLDKRAITTILEVQYEWTYLRTADLLLTAMGEGPRITTDPELRPRPNPQWSQERWMEWREEQGGCI